MTKLLLSASFLLLALAPSRAEACSPPLSSIDHTVPASGATYPVNAPIQVIGSGLDLSKLTATIDGVPAQVDAVSSLAGQGVKLTPEPKVGQTVHVTGKVCEPYGDDQTCSVDLTYTGGEADTTPPGAISAVSFDVFDYADVKGGGGTCTQDSDLRLYVRVTSQDVSAATPETWLLDGFDAATGKELLFAGTYTRTGAEQVITATLLKSALHGATLPSGVCLELTGLDLAGNKGTPVRQCLPCRFRADSTAQSWAPDEPTWTSADVVAGGSCEADGSGGSGQGSGGTSGDGPAIDGVSSDGGGCAAVRGRAGSGGGLLGLTLGLVAMVRRRVRG